MKLDMDWLKVLRLPTKHITTQGTYPFIWASAEYLDSGYSGRILFVVQPNERNVFDQRWLEYDLLERCALDGVMSNLTLMLDHLDTELQ
jgi:hypothetical protein